MEFVACQFKNHIFSECCVSELSDGGKQPGKRSRSLFSWTISNAGIPLDQDVKEAVQLVCVQSVAVQRDAQRHDDTS